MGAEDFPYIPLEPKGWRGVADRLRSALAV